MLAAIPQFVPCAQQRGWISSAELIDGTMQMLSLPGRNFSYRVKRYPSRDLIVKQVRAVAPLFVDAQRREALCYENSLQAGSALSNLLPTWFDFAERQHLLAISWLDGYTPCPAFSSIKDEQLTQVVTALARVHNDETSTLRTAIEATGIPPALPFMLQGDYRQSELLEYISPEMGKLLDLFQQHPYRTMLEQARAVWKVESPIHGDVRGANFLFSPQQDQLAVIDWELADLGDPAWDIAGLIIDFVVGFSNASVLENNLPAWLRPWDLYKQCRGPCPSKRDFLGRILLFTSVRILQSILEHAYFDPGPETAQLLLPIARVLFESRAQISQAIEAS